jgi:branched-chain amino acid aminotransferase
MTTLKNGAGPAAPLPRLQSPKWIYSEGRIRPFDEAVLHVTTEAVQRGLNVFEGLKGYWQPDGTFGIVALKRHYERLQRSARLLHIPFDVPYDEFEDACHSLVAALCEPGYDMWVRATLYVTEGHWGEDTVADLVLTAYHQAKEPPKPVAMGVSVWRRAPDLALPCRIKTSSNYQVARLARIDMRRHGYDEMVLLNPEGRVAEGLGACMLMVRDGKVSTPPAWEGALESITVDIVEALATEMGIPFERRPVDLSELHIADELGPAPIVDSLLRRYRDAVTGVQPHPSVAPSCRAVPEHAV